MSWTYRAQLSEEEALANGAAIRPRSVKIFKIYSDESGQELITSEATEKEVLENKTPYLIDEYVSLCGAAYNDYLAYLLNYTEGIRQPVGTALIGDYSYNLKTSVSLINKMLGMEE